MHEYDIALKHLLQASTDSILRQLTGVSVARWLNSELPHVQMSRVDLLGATTEGGLVHLELQSSNDSDMAIRMLQYAVGILRQFKKFPNQIVLYVGEAPLRMRASLCEPDVLKPKLTFHYTLVDIRDLDSNILLASPHIEDNLLAILTNLQDRGKTVHEILLRIAALEQPARRSALKQLLLISGLRRLSPSIEEEAQKMPILNDIIDHEVFGPLILKGRREGRQEMLKRLLEGKFGPLPQRVEVYLAALSASELDETAIRIFDCSRLEDLFPSLDAH